MRDCCRRRFVSMKTILVPSREGRGWGEVGLPGAHGGGVIGEKNRGQQGGRAGSGSDTGGTGSGVEIVVGDKGGVHVGPDRSGRVGIACGEHGIVVGAVRDRIQVETKLRGS